MRSYGKTSVCIVYTIEQIQSGRSSLVFRREREIGTDFLMMELHGPKLVKEVS
jgi:hypothetical protein